MMQKRMETLMQKLPAGTDAALIQSDVNRRYLTGMQSSAEQCSASATGRI